MDAVAVEATSSAVMVFAISAAISKSHQKNSHPICLQAKPRFPPVVFSVCITALFSSVFSSACKCYFVKAKSISSNACECRRLLNSWLIQSWWIANWGVQNEKSWTLQTCTTVSTIPVPCLQECKCDHSNRGIFPLIRCRYAEAHLILPIQHTLPTARACTYIIHLLLSLLLLTHITPHTELTHRAHEVRTAHSLMTPMCGVIYAVKTQHLR